MDATYAVPRLPFGPFLAMRYLKPRRTFVSIITLISILGVTLGIAVMIVVISVMTGFDRDLKAKVLWKSNTRRALSTKTLRLASSTLWVTCRKAPCLKSARDAAC